MCLCMCLCIVLSVIIINRGEGALWLVCLGIVWGSMSLVMNVGLDGEGGDIVWG